MKRYKVTLEPEERQQLLDLIAVGKADARKLTHARILLRADQGETDAEVAEAVEAVEAGEATVARVRTRFACEGLAAALDRRPQPPRPGKRALDGAGEAHLLAPACSPPPDGHPRWTLQLLADRVVELEYAGAVSHETVRRCLRNARPSRG